MNTLLLRQAFGRRGPQGSACRFRDPARDFAMNRYE